MPTRDSSLKDNGNLLPGYVTQWNFFQSKTKHLYIILTYLVLYNKHVYKPKSTNSRVPTDEIDQVKEAETQGFPKKVTDMYIG